MNAPTLVREGEQEGGPRGKEVKGGLKPRKGGATPGVKRAEGTYQK